ncbi:MAG TPA: hypothetical protein VEV61_09230 [Streptosporangiaceae bacterium]|nr:hypothetical protein [Streptosporangiaceae bacterium]
MAALARAAILVWFLTQRRFRRGDDFLEARVLREYSFIADGARGALVRISGDALGGAGWGR